METASPAAAAGFVSLLDEPADELKLYSLKALDSIVDEFWASIADSLPKLKALYSSDTFSHKHEAYLLASKVHFHLGDLESALECALGAGPLFDVSVDNEFVNTLIRHCIDKYVEYKRRQHEAAVAGKEIEAVDQRMEDIVMAMFDRCFRDGQYKQALGVALEARRLDKAKEAMIKSGDLQGMLDHCFQICLKVVKNLDFRRMVLRELVALHETVEKRDHFTISQILILLDDSNAIVDLLLPLINSENEEQTLLAYQLGFDLCDSCTQNFLARLRSQLATMESEVVEGKKAQFTRLQTILTGKPSVDLYLSFLCRSNKTDLAVLKNIKESVEGRNLVCHNATVFANALMHAGTTKDAFLRDNLEWLQKATHWARFSATAGLGVIHKGHMKEGKNVLKPYLPTQPSASPYSEGGSLYGLGIIHANHGQEVTEFLMGELQKARLLAHSNPTASEVIQHGACLGLGLAAMATCNMNIYEQLLDVVRQENAVAGEAAGLAMGLIMLGSGSGDAVEHMVRRAHAAQHEKIIRGLAIGMALVMYGCEEQADGLIEQLTRDKDAILRHGAMYTIGLAYCGTANNSALNRLLHVAVSDVSDDVRRSAVINLGFLLCGQPEQCPKLVSLLAESYNPHVRYGSTMAVGISCAGSGSREAIALLEPLTKDPVDFVRQGAMIALAMVIVQTSQGENPKVEKIRKLFEDRIADKHEETMAKFGAIVASAIVNGGGRNVTISPYSSSGLHRNMTAIVGLTVFCQYWYWYPLMHFVSLAFTPVCVIGLNKDLNMPEWSFNSNAPPSRFAYPPEFKPPTVEAPVKVSTAVLSTSKKVKARQQQRAAERAAKGLSTSSSSNLSASMEIDSAKDGDVKMDEVKEEEKEKKEEKVEEPSFEVKHNPARVTSKQRAVISVDKTSRWQPIKKDFHGIILLQDARPSEPVILVTNQNKAKEDVAASSSSSSSSSTSSSSTSSSSTTTSSSDAAKKEEDPAPPEEFEFDEE